MEFIKCGLHVGRRITGKYRLAVPVTGVIVDSERGYNGRYRHVVKLDEPIVTPWAEYVEVAIMYNNEVFSMEGEEVCCV